MSRLNRAALFLVAFAALSPAAPLWADEDAGAYLAARQAGVTTDYRNAAQFFTQALIADAGNVQLLENAALSFLALGDVERAVPIAKQLQSGKIESQIAAMTLLADAAQKDEWDRALADLDAGHKIGPLVDGLARAWVLLGQGEMSAAQGAFDEFGKGDGLKALGLYHKALALASVGDFEGADKIFSGEEGGPLRATRRGIIAHVEVLSQLERNPDAIALIDAAAAAEGDLDPALEALRGRLEAGEPLPFDVVRSAKDGLSEVFFSVASALTGQADNTVTLLYVRVAQYLRPDQVDAALLAAGILEAQSQFDLANEAYNLVPRDNPAFYVAELGRAGALVKAGRDDAAIEVLEQLTKSHADIALVHVTLGDLLRKKERFADATQAYDRAIALFKGVQAPQWSVYFSRGITLERQKKWPEAEADLRKALELQPDQAQVLNYLGYSFVEMNTNLDEALGMIERAVAARPDDGYITDSLGWALYKMGRYPEAEVQMERAAGLEATDPIVNDHLGDVFWAVGRKLEAEFQWRRALSFDPEEVDAVRIRAKLASGLDAVLAEEGAKPLAVSTNDN